MPVRQGYYSSGGQRAGEGIASAMEALGGAMGETQLRNQQAQRELFRQMHKELADRVMKGDMEPAEAESAAKGFGIPIKAGEFNAFQPSATSRLEKVLGPVNAATTPESFPTVPATNLALQGKQLNPMTFSNVPAEFGALPPDQLNPAAADIYGAKQDALTRIAAAHPTVMAKGQQGEGESAQPIETPSFYDPFKPVGQQRTASGPPITTGPTAGQTGRAQGATAVAAAPGQTEAELTKLLGTTYSPQVTRAKAEQAYQEEVQRTKAQGSPDALRVLAARTSVETKAKNDALLAGVPPNYADTAIHHVADGRGYFVEDPQAPPEFKRAVYVAAGKNNMRVMSQKQAQALDDIQTARANLGVIMTTLAKYAPKDAMGRVLGGPTNSFDALSQRNPELAAMKATMFAPTIALNRALITSGGPALIRMSQSEINKFLEGGLNITDDYPTLFAKVVDFNNFMKNAENGALGR